MNSVEALTDRPTSDPGVNGIMKALVYHGLGQRKWETRAHLLHHGLRHLRFLPAGHAVWRHPMTSFPGRPPRRSNRQRMWRRRAPLSSWRSRCEVPPES
jgi:hypothetical protein